MGRRKRSRSNSHQKSGSKRKRTESNNSNKSRDSSSDSNPGALPLHVLSSIKGEVAGAGGVSGSTHQLHTSLSASSSHNESASAARIRLFVQPEEAPEFPFVGHAFPLQVYLLRGPEHARQVVPKVPVPLNFKLVYDDDKTPVETLDSAVSGESARSMLEVKRCHPETGEVLKDPAKARKLVIGPQGQGSFKDLLKLSEKTKEALKIDSKTGKTEVQFRITDVSKKIIKTKKKKKVRIGEVSMRRANRRFAIEISLDASRLNEIESQVSANIFGEVKGLRRLFTRGMEVVRYRLTVEDKAIEEVFYKDEGGKDRFMSVSVGLVGPTGVITGNAMPLSVVLCYKGGRHVANQDLLKLSEKTKEALKIDSKTGKTEVQFRITDVSKNHQNLPFCLEVLPDTQALPMNFDVAGSFSSTCVVRSKRNKKTRERERLRRQQQMKRESRRGGSGGGSSSSSSKGDGGKKGKGKGKGKGKRARFKTSGASSGTSASSNGYQSGQSEGDEDEDDGVVGGGTRYSHAGLTRAHIIRYNPPPPDLGGSELIASAFHFHGNRVPLQRHANAQGMLDLPLAVSGTMHYLHSVIDTLTRLQWVLIGYELTPSGLPDTARPIYRCPACYAYRGMHQLSTAHKPGCAIGNLLMLYQDSVSTCMHTLISYKEQAMMAHNNNNNNTNNKVYGGGVLPLSSSAAANIQPANLYGLMSTIGGRGGGAGGGIKQEIKGGGTAAQTGAAAAAAAAAAAGRGGLRRSDSGESVDGNDGGGGGGNGIIHTGIVNSGTTASIITATTTNNNNSSSNSSSNNNISNNNSNNGTIRHHPNPPMDLLSSKVMRTFSAAAASAAASNLALSRDYSVSRLAASPSVISVAPSSSSSSSSSSRASTTPSSSSSSASSGGRGGRGATAVAAAAAAAVAAAARAAETSTAGGNNTNSMSGVIPSTFLHSGSSAASSSATLASAAAAAVAAIEKEGATTDTSPTSSSSSSSLSSSAAAAPSSSAAAAAAGGGGAAPARVPRMTSLSDYVNLDRANSSTSMTNYDRILLGRSLSNSSRDGETRNYGDFRF